MSEVNTAPVSCDLLIDGALVITLDATDRVIADGAVAITNDRIVAVERSRDAATRFTPRRRIDARDRIVMPGLVNTHNHTPLVITRGMVEDLGFAPMYTPRVPQGYRLSAEEAYLLSRLGAYELLRFGSTTACDNYRHPDACARAMSETGLRAFVGGRIHDADPAALARGEWRYDPAIGQATIRENLDLIERWDGHDNGRIRCFLAPHAPDTCSRDLLLEIAKLSGTDGPAPHIHFAQSRDEVAQVQQRDRRRPSEVLDDVGLLNARLVAGHCIYLDPDEIARVGAAGIRVAHVPIGNASSGMMAPIKKLEDAGALITLATDTKSHDLFQSMRMAIAVTRIQGAGYQINARTMLRWAITNGALALGLGDEIGALAPGMKADLLVLDALTPSLRPIVDGFGIVVHSGVGANVQTVVVDGRVVLDDDRPTRFDSAEVIAAAQRVADRLWRESGWTPVLAKDP